jgi:hypothetical protein
MISRTSSLSLAFRSLLVLAAGAIFLSGIPAQAAGGTVAFHATVSGKAHESGSFSRAISAKNEDPANPLVYFVGCAIVKQKKGSISGKYVFQVLTAMIQLAGLKPAGPGVNLTVDHFQPSTTSYKGLDVTGTFSINGHAYGDGRQFHGTVTMKNGGKSGTWTDTSAQRNYPAQMNHPQPGYSFKASWTCSTVLHLTQQ